VTDVETLLRAAVSADLTREGLRMLVGDRYDFETACAFYGAMRARVNGPRRRIGGDVVRLGRVLFAPSQGLYRSPH
jgi:hypothetical protein